MIGQSYLVGAVSAAHHISERHIAAQDLNAGADRALPLDPARIGAAPWRTTPARANLTILILDYLKAGNALQ